MTWRDDVGVAHDGPVRAGWEILDAARSIAFTGEIEFPLMPVARVYLDRGRVYFAERDDDPDVADRLVAAGAVRPEDLARGVLVVQGTDHLGRLFDRVPSLDRQRVMLALERLTEETAAWAAGQSVRTSTTRPYTYHPSGVHRWYDPVAAPAPAAPFSAPVLGDRLPRPDRPPRRPPPGPTDLPDVGIAWPEDAATSPTAPTTASPPRPPSAPAGAVPGDLPIDEPGVADTNTSGAGAGQPDDHPHDTSVDLSEGDEWSPPPGDATVDFEVRWPSGEVERPSVPVARTSTGSVGDLGTAATSGADAEEGTAATPAARVGLDRFDSLVPSGDPDEGGDEDPDMAIAVRRAIAAVQSGTARGRPIATVVPVLDDVPDPFERWSGADESRRRESDRSGVPDDDPFGLPAQPPTPTESAVERSIDERRTALQRLIDSLRGR